MASTTERPLADALTAIKTRRSVKEYLQTEIPREWIEELLDAAHWAPNHKLTHPWRFHVFSGAGRERLVGARQAAVRWAAEKKGEPVSEEALNFARAKCFSSPRQRATHRTAPLRRLQRETAQNRHWAQSAHRPTGEHPARQSRTLQARQGTPGAPGSRREVLNEDLSIRATSIPQARPRTNHFGRRAEFSRHRIQSL